MAIFLLLIGVVFASETESERNETGILGLNNWNLAIDVKKQPNNTYWHHPDMKSNMCKIACIDRGYNFCLHQNKSSGECCDDEDSCNKLDEDIEWSICSEANPKAPSLFKYMVCPNEDECGYKDLWPRKNETYTRVVNRFSGNYVVNDICSYIVH